MEKGNRSSLLRKADTAFSKYIRLRDMDPANGTFVCISCGRRLSIGEADCGHYINRHHMSLRFSEINCNAQCRSCNRFDEGNIQGYRRGLVAKYGEDAVLLLESKKYAVNKISSVELELIATHYRKQAKKLAAEKKRDV